MIYICCRKECNPSIDLKAFKTHKWFYLCTSSIFEYIEIPEKYRLSRLLCNFAERKAISVTMCYRGFDFILNSALLCPVIVPKTTQRQRLSLCQGANNRNYQLNIVWPCPMWRWAIQTCQNRVGILQTCQSSSSPWKRLWDLHAEDVLEEFRGKTCNWFGMNARMKRGKNEKVWNL